MGELAVKMTPWQAFGDLLWQVNFSILLSEQKCSFGIIFFLWPFPADKIFELDVVIISEIIQLALIKRSPITTI